MAVSNHTLWQPAVGATWNYLLKFPVNLSVVSNTSLYDAWGIDLFDNPSSTIQALQNGTGHVLCYFSAGSYENWRPDASNFSASDLGDPLDGWPGERWLNISSPTVRSIMLNRLDLAVQKNCSGVDPDNVDGYSNKNGLNLTAQDSIDYMRFLANATIQRGLSIGLKNAQDIIPDLLDQMHWAVNEQCTQFEECSAWQPFINASKPVFNVEYPKGDKSNNDPVSAEQLSTACDDPDAKGFSTIIKNMDLDWWIETCNGKEVNNTAATSNNSASGGSSSAAAGAKSGMAPLLLLSLFSLISFFL